MKVRVTPLLLGSFIVGALVLLIAGLIAFGSHNPLKKVAHFVCYFEESAQGLNDATAVSIAGIHVGQVDKVGVVYDERERRAKVVLTCEIRAERLTDTSGQIIHLTSDDEVQRLVEQGMRAQIATSGLVGAKYINLDFYNPAQHPIPSDLPKSRYPVVPTVPGTMSELMQDAQGVLASVRRIDFASIGQQAREVLVGLNRQVNELQTNRLTDHLSVAAESFGHLAASTNVQELVAHFQDAAESLNLLLTNLNTQIGPLVDKADNTLSRSQGTLSSITQAAHGIQDFVDLRNGLGEQTRALEEQLSQAAHTIEDLADFLERHPNALITGRSQESGTP